MMLNEVIKATNLTRKAIEYYCHQGFITPTVRDNGYREFSRADILCLQQIAVLRKLGVTTREIKKVLSDTSGNELHELAVRKELNVQREQAKKAILDKLSKGSSYDKIAAELKALDESATITERLLESFPGYYGRFICLHFARFLNEPLTTPAQQSAYNRIIDFLDHIAPLEIPEEIQKYLDESTKWIGTEQISQIIESTRRAVANPEEFLNDNKEVLEQYLEFKQSDEYQKYPFAQIQELFKEFHQSSGYYDIFIPALKELSPSYAEYYRQMEAASEVLLERYPEAAGRSEEAAD